jgi:hypothetical protein
VPALRPEPHTHHRDNALGELFSSQRAVRLRERSEDHQAEQLVTIILRHDDEK